MKTCPYCAEEIQDAAILCKHCGKELSDEQPPMAKIDRIISAAREHLEAGEVIVASCIDRGSTVFLATDRRLVSFKKKLVSFKMEVFDYDNISSFKASKGFLVHKISFSSLGKKKKIEIDRVKCDVKAFVDAVCSGMGLKAPVEIEPAPRVLGLASGRRRVVALALVGISLIIGLATIGLATDGALGALAVAFVLCFTGLVILSKGWMILRVPIALFLAVMVFGYFGGTVGQRLERQRLLVNIRASQAMQRQRAQEVVIDYAENRESNLADMDSVEASVEREEWEEARDAASELRARIEPLLKIVLGNLAADFPEIADFKKRFENADGRIQEVFRDREVEARLRAERAQQAQQLTFGPWRDTMRPGYVATMTITDFGEGKARLQSKFTDGSEPAQELREVEPRATERRRWEQVGDEHVYAIRKSDGFLDLFDSQGHIRTAVR